jgi:hypothetical protein
MIKQFVRGLLVIGIGLAAGYANGQVAELAAEQSAQKTFYARQFDPNRDVQFSINGLQQYTTETARSAADLAQGYQLMVALAAFALTAFVMMAPTPDRKPQPITETQLLFQRWISAAKKNNSLEMAAIETQVQETHEQN